MLDFELQDVAIHILGGRHNIEDAGCLGEQSWKQEAIPAVEAAAIGGKPINDNGRAHLLRQFHCADAHDFGRSIGPVYGDDDATPFVHDLHGLLGAHEPALVLGLALIGRRAADDEQAHQAGCTLGELSVP